MSKKPILLTIAGFDSGCGAGVVADVCTARVLGAYGLVAQTCITVQNTTGIRNIFPIPEKIVQEQIEALFEDFDISAVKIGVLYSRGIASIVSSCLERFNPKFIVLDPIIESSSGTPLSNNAALELICEKIIPICSVVTPNFSELCKLLRLLGKPKLADALECSESRIHLEDLYAKVSEFFLNSNLPAFFVKGGHLPASVLRSPKKKQLTHFDALFSNGSVDIFEQEFVNTDNSHGTGCALSTALSVELSRNITLLQAVKKAQEFVFQSILLARESNFGSGNCSVEHFVPNYLLKYHLKGKL